MWIEAAFLIAGFFCLIWVGSTFAESAVYQSYEKYQLEQTLRGSQGTALGYLRYIITGDSGSKPQQSRTEYGSPAEKPRAHKEVPPDGLIGRIEIPRLRVSAVIREGADDKTLKRAVGHIPDTALPGDAGNFGIAAHRDTFFRGLRGVRKGDVISVVTPEGTYKYEVDAMNIVWPENVEVLDPTPEPVITLVTCYPFDYIGSAPKRFIVRAKQIAPEASVARATGLQRKGLAATAR